jgi:hypothetical protein
VFGWPDPNTGFDQSEHALYTCYFIKTIRARSLLASITKTKYRRLRARRQAHAHVFGNGKDGKRKAFPITKRLKVKPDTQFTL